MMSSTSAARRRSALAPLLASAELLEDGRTVAAPLLACARPPAAAAALLILRAPASLAGATQPPARAMMAQHATEAARRVAASSASRYGSTHSCTKSSSGAASRSNELSVRSARRTRLAPCGTELGGSGEEPIDRAPRPKPPEGAASGTAGWTVTPPLGLYGRLASTRLSMSSRRSRMRGSSAGRLAESCVSASTSVGCRPPLNMSGSSCAHGSAIGRPMASVSAPMAVSASGQNGRPRLGVMPSCSCATMGLRCGTRSLPTACATSARLKKPTPRSGLSERMTPRRCASACGR
mmetsp:Transcript_1102/g.4399  ORF Transcript_1102/g.4399 Transcript_1102/m.4399 type:complete len:294 (-) Transcript_1102:1019-1900(-)